METDSAAAPAGERAASALRVEIEQTRADMKSTIEQLESRLDPAAIKDKTIEQFDEIRVKVKDAVREQIGESAGQIRGELIEARDAARHEIQAAFIETKQALRDATIGKVETMARRMTDTVIETGESLLETIRQNPIPAVMTGVGLAWLLMNRSSAVRSREHDDRRWQRPMRLSGRQTISHSFEQAQEKLSGLAHQASEATGHLAHQASDSANHLAHQASESASHLAHQASDSANHLAHQASDGAEHLAEQARHAARQARHQARRVEERATETMRENPLAFGAVALAVGAMVGMALPRTSREDDLMGEARDILLAQAQHAVQGAMHDAQHLAERGAEEARSAIQAS